MGMEGSPTSWKKWGDRNPSMDSWHLKGPVQGPRSRSAHFSVIAASVLRRR